MQPGGGAELLHITAKPAMVIDTELQERLKLWREVHQQVILSTCIYCSVLYSSTGRLGWALGRRGPQPGPTHYMDYSGLLLSNSINISDIAKGFVI